jgi:hypothetical protein
MGRPVIDLTGKRVGTLVVVERVDDYISPKGDPYSQWLCKCDCGNDKVVLGNTLRREQIKSCGCQRKKLLSKARTQDLTGKRFGKLIVVERGENYISPRGITTVRWSCRCDCGNNVLVIASNLRKKICNSCGCLRKELAGKRSLENLTGQRFGRLVVVERSTDYVDPKGNHSVKWLCKCDCGNSKVILANSLKSGTTTSCGCYAKEVLHEVLFKDLVGKRFGKLVVVELSRSNYENGTGDGTHWKCLCDCGSTTVVQAGNLEKTMSCGCLRESMISSELKKHCAENYDAISEYKVLRNPDTNHYLPYDIYIPRYSAFIEINGGQHYQYTNGWHLSLEDFYYSQTKDKIKRNYALENGLYIEIDLRTIKSTEEAISYINNILLKADIL